MQNAGISHIAAQLCSQSNSASYSVPRGTALDHAGAPIFRARSVSFLPTFRAASVVRRCAIYLIRVYKMIAVMMSR